MKILRIALWLLAAVAALVAAVALAAWLLFDAQAVKAQSEKLVLEATGRQLRIGGDLSLSVFPRLGVEMADLRLSERGQPETPFASVERVRVGVRLLPLLQRRVEADEILLVAPDVRLVRDRNGHLNIADLAGQPAAADKAAEGDKKTAPAAPLPRIALAGVRVEKGRLTYRDEGTGKEIVVSDLGLRFGELGTQAKGRAVLGASLALGGKQLRGDLETDYVIDAGARRLGLSGLSGRVTGAVATLSELDVQIKLAAVSANAAPAAAGGAAAAPLLLQGIELRGGGRLAADRVDLKLVAPRVELAGERLGGEPLVLDLGLEGSGRRLRGSVNVAEWQRQGAVLSIGKLAVRWNAAVAQLATQGQLATRLEVLTAEAGPRVHVGDYRGDTEVRHPALAGGPLKLAFDGSARADLGAGNAEGRGQFRFDETNLQASWALPRLAPWQATFDVAIDRLNVDRYLPPKAAVAPGGAKGAPGATAPAGADTPVDLAALRGLDFSGNLRVGALQVSGARLANLRAKMQAHEGRLTVAPFSADLYEGRASGSLSAAAGAPQRLAVLTTLESINLQPLLRDVAKQDVLSGRGRVTLDLNASGASVSALKRSLQGSAALGLRDGAVKGINLAKSLRDLKARLGGGEDVVQAASGEEKTDFSELQASFRIAQGVARNDDFNAKSPFLRVSGAGAVDIGESRLDYLVKANVVSTSTGQDGKGLEHVRGLTVPVRLAGPFDKLSYKIELAQVARDAAKERLKEKLGEKLGSGSVSGTAVKEAAKQRLEEKLDQKLKGLFGR